MPMRPLWAGVDIGTTNVKAQLTGADGTVVIGRAETHWTSRAERTETTPGRILDSVACALQDACSQAREEGPIAIRGIAIAGLAESGMLLTPRGDVEMPVVAWFDQRGAAEVRALPLSFASSFPASTGLYLTSMATAAKLLWWRGTGGAIAPGARFLSVPEYVAYALGGTIACEPSLASRTGLFDVVKGSPWTDGMAQLGLTQGLLPEPVEAGQPWGEVAEPMGITELAGATITVAGHDHVIASVGAGAIGDNDMFDSCGTADVIVRSVPLDRLSPEQIVALVGSGIEVGRHVLPGRFALNGGVRSGLSLRRILDLLGVTTPAARDRLERAAAELTEPGPGVRVEGVSNQDDGVRITVREGASPAALWLAGIEAAAGLTAGLVRAIEAEVGPHDCGYAAGGWIRSASVRRAKERLFPGIQFRPQDELGASGACRLARFASETPSSSLSDFLLLPTTTR